MARRKSEIPFVSKREFCARMYEKGAFDRKSEVEHFFDTFCECLHELLANEEQITLPGVGFFKIAVRIETNAVNPRTGQKIRVPAAKFIKFTPTMRLKNLYRERWEKESGGSRVIENIEEMPFPDELEDDEGYYSE